jgi:hypothetical protein
MVAANRVALCGFTSLCGGNQLPQHASAASLNPAVVQCAALQRQARALAASNEQLEHRLAAATAGAELVQSDAGLPPDLPAAKMPNGVSHQQPAPVEDAMKRQPETQPDPGIAGSTDSKRASFWFT